MNEVEIYYRAAFLIGFCISGLWVVAYVAVWACHRVWAWVDDSKVRERNWLVEKIAYMQGYQKTKSGIWKYKKGGMNSDGEYPFFIAVGITSPLPLVIVFLVDFYLLGLFLVVGTVIAFIARLGRRNKKMFDAHVKDENAHKGGHS